MELWNKFTSRWGHGMNNDLFWQWLVQDMQQALDAVARAVPTTINPNIKHLPCHLAFNHDMIFHCAVLVNWEVFNKKHHKLITASNTKENQTSPQKNFSLGDQVLILLDGDEHRRQPKKQAPTKKGPYTITWVNKNGTVEISHGNVTETINIRCIKAYFS